MGSWYVSAHPATVGRGFGVVILFPPPPFLPTWEQGTTHSEESKRETGKMSDSGRITDLRNYSFFMVDNEIVDNYNLSPNALLAYLAIARCARNGSCSFSQEYLAKKVNLSRFTFIRVLPELENAGLIQVEKPEGGKFVYTLLPVVKEPHKNLLPTATTLLQPATTPVANSNNHLLQPATHKKTNNKDLNTLFPEPEVENLHAKVRTHVQTLYEAKFGSKCPWTGFEGKRLTELINSNPSWIFTTYERLVNDRYASEGVNGERPGAWLPHLSRYMAGPLDRFGKAKQPILQSSRPMTLTEKMRKAAGGM
jgi:DNA-binding MarR family transcriptional regulator